jgi:hypothetical protein
VTNGFATDVAFKMQPAVLAGLMGHSSTKMLERCYLHANQRSAEIPAA